MQGDALGAGGVVYAVKFTIHPQARCIALPEQAACMRAENACLLLRQILDESLYMQVRSAVACWDMSFDTEAANRSAAKQAYWDKRKVG